MKIYFDDNKFDDNKNDVYITDEGTGHNGKKYRLNYLWIGSDKGHCIGTISGPSLEKLKSWIRQKNNYKRKSK